MYFGHDSLSELFSDPKTFGYMLWIGLALLTVSLMILMRTRWGQVKPISKCVALSIFAHILLGGYAYGTKLIFETRDEKKAPNPVMKITFNEATIQSDQPFVKPAKEVMPWEKFGEPAKGNTPKFVKAERTIDTESPAEIQRDQVAVETPKAEKIQTTVSTNSQIPQAQTVVQQQPSYEVMPNQAAQPEQVQGPATNAPVAVFRKPETPQQVDLVPEVPSEEISQAAPPNQIPQQIQQLDQQPVERTARELLTQDADLRLGPDTGSMAPESRRIHPRPTNARFASSRSKPALSNPAFKKYAVKTKQILRPEDLVPRRRVSDGQVLPQVYNLRVNESRTKVAIRNGGSAQTEKAVQQALAWLATAQNSDGRWSCQKWGGGNETFVLGHDRGNAGAQADTGITGLAILAFLGAGQSHVEGEYKEVVRKGLQFLARSQATNGSLAGDSRLFAAMYCHGIATLAMSEAYAMTGDDQLKRFTEQAIGYTLKSQHALNGGWRYRPGDEGDMSQFGWQVLALKSAQMAGIDTPANTYGNMVKFLDSCSAGNAKGLARYRRGEAISRTMTAESFCCRVFLGQPVGKEALSEATEYLLMEKPNTSLPNLYYWYYATMALYQVGGEPWDAWNTQLKRSLVRLQRHDGRFAGSYDPSTVWGGYGGRVYSTAMSTLCFEVYYRYLPIMRGNE